MSDGPEDIDAAELETSDDERDPSLSLVDEALVAGNIANTDRKSVV